MPIKYKLIRILNFFVSFLTFVLQGTCIYVFIVVNSLNGALCKEALKGILKMGSLIKYCNNPMRHILIFICIISTNELL